MSVAVRVRGVRRTFGTTVALDRVDLDIAEGSVLALLGPNGAGKTTLVRILATLLAPEEGRAEVFGHDVVTEAGQVRRLMALTGQFAAVDELLTGRENLTMFGRLFHLDRGEAARRADALLDRFGLPDAADRPVRTYSGGMRRRLDLASSLVADPRLLFLDEPTTGLDPRSRRQMWEVIRGLVDEGVTLLLTTQYLDEADELADRVAVIDRGRIIAEGTGDELKDEVGGQVVLVRLRDPADRDRAGKALAAIGCGEPHEPSAGTLVVPAHRAGVGLVAEAARALEDTHVDVVDLGLRRPTLDDVFLQLTGRTPAAADSQPGEERPPGRGRTANPQRTATDPDPDPRPGRGRPPFRVPTWQELARAAGDSLVVTARNLRHFVRQPRLIVFSTIQPVMFVLLFAYVFGGALTEALPPGVTYVDFLLPGIFVQSAAFRSTQTSVGLAEDLERGVIDRFRSMPMSRAAVLMGRAGADVVRSLFVVVLMVAVGYLIGFRFHRGPGLALAAVAVVTLFGFALSWIFAWVALVVRGAEAAQSGSFVAVFPLVFASSVFVPIETMPGWLETFARWNPVSVVANAVRWLALGEAIGGDLLLALVWPALITAVFGGLAVRRYQKLT